MKKKLAAIVGMTALIIFPAMAMAKSHMGGKGGANAPSPNQSAYEHADDSSKLQRDTHDMGKHHGQEEPGKGMDKDKEKAADKGKGADDGKGKSKDKDKSKDEGKGKDKSAGDDQQAVKDKEKSEKDKSGKEQGEKDQGGKDKEKEMGLEKGKEKSQPKAGSDAGNLLEQVKQKGGKAK